MSFGHKVHEGHSYQSGEIWETDVLIVGGGIAGMAAAWQLRDRDFLLCELSDRPGGTSTAFPIGGQMYAQGAHYDLAYPENYGSEALNMLQELKIIEYNAFSKLWEFRDKKYTIPPQREGRCYIEGDFRADVLPEGITKEKFKDLLMPYQSDMVMPTRLIPEAHHELNNINFLEWLENNDISPDTGFLKGLDYNMRDDYGAGANIVSALAGIHYYTCRPYYTRPVELFSPPQGNFYFISKMLDEIPPSKIKTRTLVNRITREQNGFNVDILDQRLRSRHQIRAARIIYAGNKHALKYIFPPDYPLFEKNRYAPWAVMNIVLKDRTENDIFWQNEIISSHPSLIGFVDSRSQDTDPGSPQVLTVYFCLDPDNRIILGELEKQKETFTGQVISVLNAYFGRDIKKLIAEVYIRILGHAMPIPVPGYLFKDQNDSRSEEGLVFAGVDNHRLPLFFEALDSGIHAAAMILK